MFTYYEKYYKGADVSFSTLIICQYSNEEEVYYYEDINYIVKEQALYSPNLNEFSDEEIEYLNQSTIGIKKSIMINVSEKRSQKKRKNYQMKRK